MTDTELKKALFQSVIKKRPVNVMGKLPTLDDVRSHITADFSAANDVWKITAAKKVASR